ncbi:MAG: LPS export ABC transporter periplasmic protein LptC [Bacteroidales bacterium]|nr:LPS export ABC transporter periplasmic protein LptC [Bacteroidales bacterium]
MKATAVVAVAFFVASCNGMKTSDDLDLSQTPVQVVADMFIVQTDNGQMKMRTEAPLMERYRNDTLEWELFPNGFSTYAYDETGRLETAIKADAAKHSKTTKGPANETWAAFGHVSVKNLIKRETMETDTLYWDRENERIYTDCYVQLFSPSGFMQGYGMESDQRARSSVIIRPFNSYGIVSTDSTVVEVDTVNFIGPFPKK